MRLEDLQPADPKGMRIYTLLNFVDDYRKARGRRKEASKAVVGFLIQKYGGLRKAAKEVGEHPSNFSNLRSGRRILTWDRIVEFADKLEENLAQTPHPNTEVDL